MGQRGARALAVRRQRRRAVVRAPHRHVHARLPRELGRVQRARPRPDDHGQGRARAAGPWESCARSFSRSTRRTTRPTTALRGRGRVPCCRHAAGLPAEAAPGQRRRPVGERLELGDDVAVEAHVGEPVERRRALRDDRPRRRAGGSAAAARRPGRPRARSRCRAAGRRRSHSSRARQRGLGASRRTAPRRASAARRSRAAGHAVASRGQARRAPPPARPRRRSPGTSSGDAAVHLDQLAGAGAAVQHVDVLGDHAVEQPARSSAASARWAPLGRLSPSAAKRSP